MRIINDDADSDLILSVGHGGTVYVVPPNRVLDIAASPSADMHILARLAVPDETHPLAVPDRTEPA